MFSLELSRTFPSSTLVTLEPNRSLWMEHTSLAQAYQQPNVLCLHNPVTEEVAEALAHSNEFLDAQVGPDCRRLRLRAALSVGHPTLCMCLAVPFSQSVPLS